MNPYISFIPSKAAHIDAGAYFMWRQSTQDGTYSPLAKEVRPGPSALFSSASRPIGTLLTVESAFILSSNFSLGIDAGYFLAGSYVRQTGKGQNIAYTSCKVNIRL